MTPVVSDLYLLLGGALGAFGRRWVNQTWRQRETVTDVAGSALATVLCVALGIIPDALRAVLTIDPIRTVALAAFLSAGAVGLVRSALGKYGFKAGETIAAGLLVGLLGLACPASATDRGSIWQAGGITPLEDGANFAVLPISDTQTYLYTRKSTAPTQLRVYRSPDSGATVTLAQDGIVTGRATTLNPNVAILTTTGQTLLGGFSPANVGSTPEAPWLLGSGQVWTTPTVTGLPTVGPTAAPFPAPFTSGFLRAVSIVPGTNGTILSPVDNNSSNAPVVCRSTTGGASWTCVAMPATIATVRWRDPASASATAPGSAQPLATPTPSRWLLVDSNAQVFRSVDDGVSWALLTRLTTDSTVSWAITCLPGTTTCVVLTSSYANTINRLFVSRNSGDTWTQVYSVSRGDLLTTLVAAGSSTILALGDPSAKLPHLFGLQSQDGGTTWFPIVAPRGGWNGPTPVTALTQANEYYTGAEELNASLTTISGTPTFVTTTPRAVGPGHAFQTDTVGAFGAPYMTRTSGLATCASLLLGPCTMTTRFYLLTSTLTCGGTGSQDYDVASWSNNGGFTTWAITVHFTVNAGVCGTSVISLRDATASNAPTFTALGSTALALNTWYRVEQTSTYNNGLWNATLLLYAEDGTSVLDALSLVRTTALDDAPATLIFGNPLTGGKLSTLTYKIDDIGYRWAPGSTTPTLAGPASVWTVPPTSDVTVQWTPQSGTSNFAMVNDVPGTPNDGTTGNSSGTTNLVDRLGLSAFVGVPLNWQPFRAFVNFRATEGGASAFSEARVWDSFGGTLTGTTAGASGGYQTALLDHNRHLAFSANGADVTDAARWNIGYQGKIGGTTATMTAVWLNVEMEPLGTDGGGGDSATGIGPQPFWTNQQPYLRPDGSVLIWTFWSGFLGSGPSSTTPSFLQAFNAAPTIAKSAGVPLPSDPSGTLFYLRRPSFVILPRADVTVTTAVTLVLPTNPARVSGECVNNGSDNIRLGDATVTASRGVRVAPTAAFNTHSTSAVYAIAEATTATVTCTEDQQ
jgi:hypothetical protein